MRKLNYLFIMPRLVQRVGDGYVFPLGIAYVSASMKKAGFNVFTLNLNHCEGRVEEIIKSQIEHNNIDVVATGGLSPQYHLVKSIIELAKQIKGNVVTIVGGGIISADPETAMEALAFVDYGVIGEGEVTMCELARALEGQFDLREIDGIIFKINSAYIRTHERHDIANIDELPWPDYEGFDIEKYLESPSAGFAGLNKKRMICMLGSRSCPHNCTFCFHTNGKRYRQRSLDDFFAELDYLVSHYHIEYISLADELFAPNIKRAKEFCSRIKRYNIHWYADFRIDKIEIELLNIMIDSGLEVMFFGLESADNRILKSMRKGITVEQIERGLKIVYDSGIPVYGCFIFGDIEETVETADITLEWWRKHSEYQVHLTLLKPFPGSRIYEYACKKGIIKDRVQYLKDGCPQVNISKMSDDEFASIVRKISDAQRMAMPIDSVELIKYDKIMGRETISGICPKCSGKCIWESIKLFAIDYIYCEYCGQKFDIPYPIQLRNNFDKNIEILLAKFGKVAVWGMTLPVIELFKQSPMLQRPEVYAVDISASKRAMDMYGKSIKSPAILREAGIRVAVIAVPSHAGQISCQIQQDYPGVTELIEICHLMDFEPIAKS